MEVSKHAQRRKDFKELCQNTWAESQLWNLLANLGQGPPPPWASASAWWGHFYPTPSEVPKDEERSTAQGRPQWGALHDSTVFGFKFKNFNFLPSWDSQPFSVWLRTSDFFRRSPTKLQASHCLAAANWWGEQLKKTVRGKRAGKW